MPEQTSARRRRTLTSRLFVFFHVSLATGKLEEEEVRVLEKGDYFGEQALLREECRSANVIALAPGVECLTLGRE